MLETLLHALVDAAIRRGVRGGSRPWMAVGIGAGAVLVYRRAAMGQGGAVLQEPIEPGDRVELRLRHRES